MCFDQLAADVDPYQCAIRSDLDLHAHIPTRRHRIQGAIDSNMPVGMNLAVGPVRRVKAPALERNQNRLLFGLEDLDRYSTCCSMNAAPGRIPTQMRARRSTSLRSMNVSPLKKRSRTKRTVFSTMGLSFGCRGRAASGRKPR